MSFTCKPQSALLVDFFFIRHVFALPKAHGRFNANLSEADLGWPNPEGARLPAKTSLGRP